MRYYTPEEIRNAALPEFFELSGLGHSTGLTPPRKPADDAQDIIEAPKKNQHYDNIYEAESKIRKNTSSSLWVHRKKKDDLHVILQPKQKGPVFDPDDNDDSSWRWRRRPPRVRAGADSKKKPHADADSEKKPNADADSERNPHADAEGERTPNADGERVAGADTGTHAPRVVHTGGDEAQNGDTRRTETTNTAEGADAGTARANAGDVEAEATRAADARAGQTPDAMDTGANPPRAADGADTARGRIIGTNAADIVATPGSRAITGSNVVNFPQQSSVHVPGGAPRIITTPPQPLAVPAPAPASPDIPRSTSQIDARGTAHMPEPPRLSPGLGNVFTPDLPPPTAMNPSGRSPVSALTDLGSSGTIDLPRVDGNTALAFDTGSGSGSTHAIPRSANVNGMPTPEGTLSFRNYSSAPLPEIPDSLDSMRFRPDAFTGPANLVEPPNLADSRVVVPSTDAETIRAHSAAPLLDSSALPDTPPPTRSVTAAPMSEFGMYLENRGTNVAEFNEKVNAPAPGRTGIDIGDTVNAPRIAEASGRAGRFGRMVMPNMLDYAIIGAVAGYAAYATTELAVGDDADITLGNIGGMDVGLNVNGWAVIGAAADAAPWVDALAAKARGHDDEAWVRTVVNGVETVTPFALAAGGALLGAKVGGAGGATAGGVGAIPGAVGGAAVGGTGGFIAGLFLAGGISIAADETLRAYGRAKGWDVERGFISSWLAPKFSDDMESWLRKLNSSGVEIPDDATPQQVIDGILSSTDNPVEQLQKFQEFLTIMNDGLHAQQNEHLESIQDIVAAHTGGDISDITDIRAVLDGPPEQREHFISFYQERLADNPDNASAEMVLNVVAEYDALQENRYVVQQAMLNANIMHAVSMNEDIRDTVDLTSNYLLPFIYATETYQIQQEYMANANADISNPVRVFAIYSNDDPYIFLPELQEIDVSQRLRALSTKIEEQREANKDINRLIAAVAADNGDAYLATGAVDIIYESMSLYADMEQAYSEAADRIATTHMDKFEIFFDNYDRLESYINEELEDAREDMPEAAEELERIIAESDNFRNLTDEHKLALAHNQVFRDSLESVSSGLYIFSSHPNPDLREAYRELDRTLKESRYYTAISGRELIREHKAELQETLEHYGVQMELESDAPSPEVVAQLSRDDQAPTYVMP